MTEPRYRIVALDSLAEDSHDAAARLYWAAFRGKLGRLLGPDDKALSILRRAMQPDHALVAVIPGDLVVAVAGFRSPRGSFLPLTSDHLMAIHGRAGGLWRMVLLRWLGRDVDNRRFLIDGLAVAEDWRSRGLGTALIDALTDEGRRRGYAALRLDVADENTRARALYERIGFAPAEHQRLRLLAPFFGMRGSTVMERPIRAPLAGQPTAARKASAPSRNNPTSWPTATNVAPSDIA